MSFGFAVGDFVAVGKLIIDIVGSLHSTEGAGQDYQELVRELESLDKALKHVDRLQGTTADGVKCAALMCRYPLEDFRNKIKKYERHLGTGGDDGFPRSTAQKLHWTFGKRNEIAKLRNYLSLHIGSINMQLLGAGLETLKVLSNSTDDFQEVIKAELSQSRTTVADLATSLNGQTLLFKTTLKAVGRLCDLLRGELIALIKEILRVAIRICVSTQEIHSLVLDIRAKLAPVDTDHTYFQTPVKVEDTIGRIWPVPAEYSTAELHAVILQKFVGHCSHQQLKFGNYELFNENNRQQVISIGDHMPLNPGMSIKMAVIVPTLGSESQCPAPMCGSLETASVYGGGRTCTNCGIWFDGTSLKRRPTTNKMLDFLIQYDSALLAIGDRKDSGVLERYGPQCLIDAESAAASPSIPPFKNVVFTKEPASTKLRPWNSSSGDLITHAEFAGMANHEIVLHQVSGTRIRVLPTELSLEDLKYVESKVEDRLALISGHNGNFNDNLSNLRWEKSTIIKYRNRASPTNVLLVFEAVKGETSNHTISSARIDSSNDRSKQIDEMKPNLTILPEPGFFDLPREP